MIEAKDNDMVITREDGTEDLWKIYFYYVEEESGKTFYFLYKDEDPDSLIVMASLDGKELSPVSEEELARAEEVLAAYEEDPAIQEAK